MLHVRQVMKSNHSTVSDHCFTNVLMYKQIMLQAY